MATFPGGGNGTVTYDSATGTFYNNGVQISPTFTVADWTALNAIPQTAANDNLLVFVTGIGPNGSLWRYVHASTRWVNVGSPILYYSGVFGTIASPTCTIGAGVTAATLFNTGSTISFPANMLRAGSRIRIMTELARTSGVTHAAATAVIYLGTANNATDPSMAGGTLTDNDGYTLNMNPKIHVADSTHVVTTYANPFSQGSTINNGVFDKTTNINTASVMYVNVGMGAKDTADIFKLLSLEVWIENI